MYICNYFSIFIATIETWKLGFINVLTRIMYIKGILMIH